MMRFVIVLLLLGCFFTASAQPNPTAAADTNRIFTLDNLFELIKEHHPIARQSKLLTQQAAAQMLQARGGFDPQLYSYLDQKTFDGKNYFTLAQNGFKIPTWYGIEVKGGYNINNGQFLNPENKLPVQGQAVAGVSLTLIQGLVIDQRRAALKQARIFAQANEAERQDMLNNLLFDAAAAYWEWALAYNQLLLQQQAVQLAQVRLEWVKNTFLQGARPAIDTLEALIQLQNRQYDQNETELQYQNTSLLLSTFLWADSDTPLEITNAITPPNFSNLALPSINPDSVQLAFNRLSQIHPQLLLYQFKLSNLDVERRLKAEKLKPKLNLNYNLLANGLNFAASESPGNVNPFLQNYKWGLEFSMPLFLRAERGSLQLTRLKIQEANLQLQQKQWELQNKLQGYYNELLNNQRQIALYRQTVNNYQALTEGEEFRFRFGESSLFLVNTRESKLLEAQGKLLELKAKHHKILAGIAFSGGTLFKQ
ncbi:MAG TPA: TolC family protein [Chitinophagales bacterium]|nr:TolC family protein [Chitinophagales bacterium]